MNPGSDGGDGHTSRAQTDQRDVSIVQGLLVWQHCYNVQERQGWAWNFMSEGGDTDPPPPWDTYEIYIRNRNRRKKEIEIGLEGHLWG